MDFLRRAVNVILMGALGLAVTVMSVVSHATSPKNETNASVEQTSLKLYYKVITSDLDKLVETFKKEIENEKDADKSKTLKEKIKWVRSLKKHIAEETAEIISNKLNPPSIKIIAVSVLEDDRIEVVIPPELEKGVMKEAVIRRIIEKKGVLEFRLVLNNLKLEEAARKAAGGKEIKNWCPDLGKTVPADKVDADTGCYKEGEKHYEVFDWLKARKMSDDNPDEDDTYYLVSKKVELSNKHIKKVEANPFGENGFPQVDISFTPDGSKVAIEFTRTNITKQMAIVLDGVLLTAPIIQGEFRDAARLTGALSMDEAKRLATAIQTGNFPADIEYIEK